MILFFLFFPTFFLARFASFSRNLVNSHCVPSSTLTAVRPGRPNETALHPHRTATSHRAATLVCADSKTSCPNTTKAEYMILTRSTTRKRRRGRGESDLLSRARSIGGVVLVSISGWKVRPLLLHGTRSANKLTGRWCQGTSAYSPTPGPGPGAEIGSGSRSSTPVQRYQPLSPSSEEGPRSVSPDDRRISESGTEEQQVAQRSRWHSVLLEAGGLSAALSDESMRRLKYCLGWLQVSLSLFLERLSFTQPLFFFHFVCSYYLTFCNSMRLHTSTHRFSCCAISLRRCSSRLKQHPHQPRLRPLAPLQTQIPPHNISTQRVVAPRQSPKTNTLSSLTFGRTSCTLCVKSLTSCPSMLAGRPCLNPRGSG